MRQLLFSCKSAPVDARLCKMVNSAGELGRTCTTFEVSASNSVFSALGCAQHFPPSPWMVRFIGGRRESQEIYTSLDRSFSPSQEFWGKKDNTVPHRLNVNTFHTLRLCVPLWVILVHWSTTLTPPTYIPQTSPFVPCVASPSFKNVTETFFKYKDVAIIRYTASSLSLV